jgi:hypothetical protein
MLVVGCTSPRAMIEPPVETAPVVEPALTGPPPGYVRSTNYWVRERIILTSEQEPTKSATPKSPVKKQKKTKKSS